MKDKLIKLSSDLITFRSIKENYSVRKDIIKFVKDYFKDDNVYIEEYDYNNVPSIVISLEKTKEPKIFLSGHLDVVDAKDEDFKPRVEGNKLYGRGSGDMKTACAVMMELLRYFSKEKNKASLALMLTTDEELGGLNGAGYLVNEVGYKSKVVMVPDGGKDLKTIILNQKGILHIKIKAHGKLAHGARPFWGENAIDKLINIYLELRKEIPELKERLWENTLNLSKISGGQSTNSVPDYAEMTLDIRFINPDYKDKILDNIKKLTDNFEILATGYPTIQYEDDPYMLKYKKIMEEELGSKIEFSKVEGASDARFFSAKGVSTIVTKINTENIHGDGEWVDLDEMESFYNAMIKYIKEVENL